MLSSALQGEILISSCIISAQLLFAGCCSLTYLLKNIFSQTSYWFPFFPQTVWNPWQFVDSDADFSVLKHFQPCLVNHNNRLLPTKNSCLNCDRAGMRIQLLPSTRKGSRAHRSQLLSLASRLVGQALCLKVLSQLYAAHCRAKGRATGHMRRPAPGCTTSYACWGSAFSNLENSLGWPFRGSLDAFISPPAHTLPDVLS